MRTFWIYYDAASTLAARLDAHCDQVGHRRRRCSECDCTARLHEAAVAGCRQTTTHDRERCAPQCVNVSLLSQ
jgi:hypothetical protein